MKKGIIQLCYRKIIDASSQKVWDSYVFESTYTELLMQAQLYNKEKKYSSFAELLINVPGAEQLHFLVSAAIGGYMQQLNGIVPDILNNLGKHFLSFSNYRFEIINSNLKNKQQHQVAINFYSKPMLWHDTVGSFLLVSHIDEAEKEDGMLTEMIPLQPFLSIYSVNEVT